MIIPNWTAPSTVKAYTTSRQSWGERLGYHDTHQGYYSSTIPEAVAESKRLESLLQLPATPIWLTQKHTTTVIKAIPDNREKIADATFSDELHQVCIVTTADCLPILICHRLGTHVAALHAGWRGLANGIIENTLNQLQQSPKDLLVWLGPAIGPQKFEVGEDVYSAFVSQQTESSSAFIYHRQGKWLANLYELAQLRLRALGITNIYGGDFCTYTQDHLFFSYRREKAKNGRMASVIWIDI